MSSAGDRTNFIPTVVTTSNGIQQTELDVLNAAYISIDYSNISYNQYIVTAVTAYQLDLISYNFYGDESYWWLIAQFNRIFDPVNEIVPGKILLIPSPTQAMQLLQQKVNNQRRSLTGTFAQV